MIVLPTFRFPLRAAGLKWSFALVLSLALVLQANSAGYELKIAPIIILLDAGHGGKDPGNLHSKGKRWFKHEKDINLAVAQRVGAKLKKYPQVQVYYTRAKDRYITLDDRIALIKTYNANYFYSIHCNSNPNPMVMGSRTHYHDFKDPVSRSMAEIMERALVMKTGRHSRGVMSTHRNGQNIKVLQFSSVPACLVETAFMSNPDDEKYLNSAEGQDKLADGLVSGIMDFIRLRHPEQFNLPTFKVQILASSKPVQPSKFNTIGLPVQEIKTTSPICPFKYMVGGTTDPESAYALAKQLKEQGFKDAFVVRYPTAP